MSSSSHLCNYHLLYSSQYIVSFPFTSMSTVHLPFRFSGFFLKKTKKEAPISYMYWCYMGQDLQALPSSFPKMSSGNWVENMKPTATRLARFHGRWLDVLFFLSVLTVHVKMDSLSFIITWGVKKNSERQMEMHIQRTFLPNKNLQGFFHDRIITFREDA